MTKTSENNKEGGEQRTEWLAKVASGKRQPSDSFPRSLATTSSLA